jgi:Tfp pilus assembly protein PilV
MVVLSIAMTGFASIAMSMKQAGDNARDHYVAVNLAKNRLERGRNLRVDLLPTLAESYVLLNVHGHPDANGHFRRSTVVSNISSTLYQVTCSVELKNRLSLAFETAVENVTTLITDMDD